MQSTLLRRRLALTMCGALAIVVAGCAGNASNAEPATTTGAASSSRATSATTATATTRATAASSAAPSTRATTTAAPASSAAPAGTGAAPASAAPNVAGGATSIVVESTAEQYFVLYVKPDLEASTEVPVAIARGQAGTTTLTDGRNQLSADHYRVATFSVGAPGDVDGDGIDDLTELGDPDANPLNPAPAMDARTGAVIVPDVEAYGDLSYQGSNVGRDSYLAGLEVMKFIITAANTAHPAVYFMNTNTYNAHPMFASAVGIPGLRGGGPSAGVMRGDVVYEPDRTAADGSKGVYRFAFQPNDAYSFREIALAYEVLTTSMPFLEGDLSYYAFPNAAYPLYLKEKASYDAYRVPVIRGDA